MFTRTESDASNMNHQCPLRSSLSRSLAAAYRRLLSVLDPTMDGYNMHAASPLGYARDRRGTGGETIRTCCSDMRDAPPLAPSGDRATCLRPSATAKTIPSSRKAPQQRSREPSRAGLHWRLHCCCRAVSSCSTVGRGVIAFIRKRKKGIGHHGYVDGAPSSILSAELRPEPAKLR